MGKRRKKLKAVPKPKRAVWVGDGCEEGSDGAVSYAALSIDDEVFKVNTFVFLQVIYFFFIIGMW